MEPGNLLWSCPCGSIFMEVHRAPWDSSELHDTRMELLVGCNLMEFHWASFVEHDIHRTNFVPHPQYIYIYMYAPFHPPLRHVAGAGGAGYWATYTIRHIFPMGARSFPWEVPRTPWELVWLPVGNAISLTLTVTPTLSPTPTTSPHPTGSHGLPREPGESPIGTRGSFHGSRHACQIVSIVHDSSPKVGLEA